MPIEKIKGVIEKGEEKKKTEGEKQNFIAAKINSSMATIMSNMSSI